MACCPEPDPWLAAWGVSIRSAAQGCNASSFCKVAAATLRCAELLDGAGAGNGGSLSIHDWRGTG
eukprot:7087803-Lingulodinium_polyedra.AAC.1